MAFSYDIRFPLHSVIMEIPNKYELAPAQIVPMSWHNICSVIVTYNLCRLTCTSRTFGQVHMIQRAPSETGDFGWYYFNNKKGCMMTIEKKSKVKNWKYDFLFVHCEAGCGDHRDCNKGKLVRNPFGEPTAEETRTTCYFQYYVREDDRRRPIPSFISWVVETTKELECKRSKSSDRGPSN